MAFRYLNVMCPFFIDNKTNFKFTLKINSTLEQTNNWNLRIDEAIEKINNNSSLIKEDISEIVIDKSKSEKSFKLKSNESKVFIIKNTQLINMVCESEIIHSIYVVKNDKQKIIWIEDVVSVMDYDFKDKYEVIYILVSQGSIESEYKIKFSTLNLVLKFNLDTSVDQATSLVANFIGLMIIGFYNIYIKIKTSCAKKKKSRTSSIKIQHIKLVESEQKKEEKEMGKKDENLNKNSSNYSEFNDTNSKSNSNNNSGNAEIRFNVNNFHLPEALQLRYQSFILLNLGILLDQGRIRAVQMETVL